MGKTDIAESKGDAKSSNHNGQIDFFPLAQRAGHGQSGQVGPWRISLGSDLLILSPE